LIEETRSLAGPCTTNSACYTRTGTRASAAEVLGSEVNLGDVFRAVQKDHDMHGLLSHEEIAQATLSVLRVLSQTDISAAQANTLAARIVEDAADGHSSISFRQFEKAVLAPVDHDREATLVPRILLVSVLPVLYGLSTRIGFVTLPMHALASGLSLVEVGLVLGLFQLMRALANWAIVRRGSCVCVPMVSLAVCGFAFSVVWPHHRLSCWIYALTGLGEIILSLQHEMILLPCMAESPSSLKRQFAWVCVGACIAFVVGSGLYTNVGFHASCLLGAVASLLQLVVGGLLYLASRRRTCFSPWIHFPPDAYALRPLAVGVASLLALSHIAAPSENDEVPVNQATMLKKVDSLLDPSLGRVALDKTVMECCISTIMGQHAHWQPQEKDLELESGCKQRLRLISESCFAQTGFSPHIETAQAPWIVHMILISQIFIALCIGTFLGTGGLYYAQIFGVDAFKFGVSMGFGELMGMCISHMLPKTQPARHLNGIMSHRPFALLLSVKVAIIAVVLIFSSVPGFPLAVVFQLAFQVLNDVWTYLVNDVVFKLSPINQYRRLQGQGQMYRRIGNALAGVSGPILLSIWPPLPFILSAVLLAVWTIVLTGVLAWQCSHLHSNAFPRVPSTAAISATIQHMFNDSMVGKISTAKGTNGMIRNKSSDSLSSSCGSQSDDDVKTKLRFLVHEVFGYTSVLNLPSRLFAALA